MTSNDTTTCIQELKDLIHKFRQERDWVQFSDPYDLAAALAVEAGELLELFLWKKNTDTTTAVRQEGVLRERISEELADVIAYALILAEAANLDVATIMRSKMQKNALKYPADKVRGKAIDKAKV